MFCQKFECKNLSLNYNYQVCYRLVHFDILLCDICQRLVGADGFILKKYRSKMCVSKTALF